jgi:hypothetical protein
VGRQDDRLRVRLPGAGVQRAQCFQFLRSRRRDLFHRLGQGQRPPDRGAAFFDRGVGEQRLQLQLVGLRMRDQDAEVGDHRARATAAGTAARTRPGTGAEARAGAEVELLDEAAPGRLHHHEGPARVRGDLGRAARPRQARRGRRIGSDHGAVEIAEAIDLRGAKETDVDASALQVMREHLRQGHDEGRGFGEFAVADGQRQHVRAGADRAGLVDEDDVRRVGQPREVAGRARQADAHETHAAIPQHARGGDRHPFIAGRRRHAAWLPRLSRKPAWSRVSSTWRCIQASKVARSRAMASQRW